MRWSCDPERSTKLGLCSSPSYSALFFCSVFVCLLLAIFLPSVDGVVTSMMPAVQLNFSVSTTAVESSLGNRFPISTEAADVAYLTVIVGSTTHGIPSSVDLLHFLFLCDPATGRCGEGHISAHPVLSQWSYNMRSTAPLALGKRPSGYDLREATLLVFYSLSHVVLCDLRPGSWAAGGGGERGFMTIPFAAASLAGFPHWLVAAGDTAIAVANQKPQLAGQSFLCREVAAMVRAGMPTNVATLCSWVNVTVIQKPRRFPNNTRDAPDGWVGAEGEGVVLRRELVAIPTSVVGSLRLVSMGSAGFLLLAGNFGDQQAMQVILHTSTVFSPVYANCARALVVVDSLEVLSSRTILVTLEGKNVTSLSDDVSVVQMWGGGQLLWERSLTGRLARVDPLSTLSFKLVGDVYLVITYRCESAGYVVHGIGVASGEVLWTHLSWLPVRLLGFFGTTAGFNTYATFTTDGAQLLILRVANGERVETNIMGTGYMQGPQLLYVLRNDDRLAAISPNTVQWLDLAVVAPNFRGIALYGAGKLFVANETTLQLFHFAQEDGELCWQDNDTAAAVAIETRRDRTEVSVRTAEGAIRQCFFPNYITHPQFLLNVSFCLPNSRAADERMYFDASSNASLTFPIFFEGERRVLGGGAVCRAVLSGMHPRCEFRTPTRGVTHHGPRFVASHQNFVLCTIADERIAADDSLAAFMPEAKWATRRIVRLGERFGVFKLLGLTREDAAKRRQQRRVPVEFVGIAERCEWTVQKCFVGESESEPQPATHAAVHCPGARVVVMHMWWCMAAAGLIPQASDVHRFLSDRFGIPPGDPCDVASLVDHLNGDTALMFVAHWSESDGASPLLTATDVTVDADGTPVAAALLRFGEPLAGADVPPHGLAAHFTSCSPGFHGAHPSPYAITILGVVISSVITVLTNYALEVSCVRRCVIRIRKGLITAIFPIEFARAQLYKSNSCRASRLRFDHDLQRHLESRTPLSRFFMEETFEAVLQFMNERNVAEDVAPLTTEQINILDNFYWSSMTRRGTRRPLAESPIICDQCAVIFHIVLQHHGSRFADKENAVTLTRFGVLGAFEDEATKKDLKRNIGFLKQRSPSCPDSDKSDVGVRTGQPKGRMRNRGATTVAIEGGEPAALRKAVRGSDGADHDEISRYEQHSIGRARTRWEQLREAAVSMTKRRHKPAELNGQINAACGPLLVELSESFNDNRSHGDYNGGDGTANLLTCANGGPGGAVASPAASPDGTNPIAACRESLRSGYDDGNGVGGTSSNSKDTAQCAVGDAGNGRSGGSGEHVDVGRHEEEEDGEATTAVIYSPRGPLTPLGDPAAAEELDLLLLGIDYAENVQLDSLRVTRLIFGTSGFLLLWSVLCCILFAVIALVTALVTCDTCTSTWSLYQLVYFHIFDSGIIPNYLVAAYLRGVVTEWDKVALTSLALGVVLLLPPLVTHVIPGLVIFFPFSLPIAALWFVGHRSMTWLVQIPVAPTHFRKRLFHKHGFARLLLLAEADDDAYITRVLQEEDRQRFTMSRASRSLRFITRGASRIFMIVVTTFLISVSYTYSMWWYDGVRWADVWHHDFSQRSVGCSLESLMGAWSTTKLMTLGNLLIL